MPSPEKQIRHVVRVCEVRENGEEWPLATVPVAEDGGAGFTAQAAGKAFGPLYAAMQACVSAMVAENMRDQLRRAGRLVEEKGAGA